MARAVSRGGGVVDMEGDRVDSGVVGIESSLGVAGEPGNESSGKKSLSCCSSCDELDPEACGEAGWSIVGHKALHRVARMANPSSQPRSPSESACPRWANIRLAKQ
jgi:hypothetical protein